MLGLAAKVSLRAPPAAAGGVEVALVADHLRVAASPWVTVLGLLEKVTVGVGAVTDTVADCAAVPPHRCSLENRCLLGAADSDTAKWFSNPSCSWGSASRPRRSRPLQSTRSPEQGP